MASLKIDAEKASVFFRPNSYTHDVHVTIGSKECELQFAVSKADLKVPTVPDMRAALKNNFPEPYGRKPCIYLVGTNENPIIDDMKIYIALYGAEKQNMRVICQIGQEATELRYKGNNKFPFRCSRIEESDLCQENSDAHDLCAKAVDIAHKMRMSVTKIGA